MKTSDSRSVQNGFVLRLRDIALKEVVWDNRLHTRGAHRLTGNGAARRTFGAGSDTRGTGMDAKATAIVGERQRGQFRSIIEVVHKPTHHRVSQKNVPFSIKKNSKVVCLVLLYQNIKLF